MGRGVEGWVPREQIISANDFEQIISDLENLREISILIDVNLRIFDTKRARFFGKSFTVLKSFEIILYLPRRHIAEII